MRGHHMLKTQLSTALRGLSAARKCREGLLRSHLATEQGEVDEIIEANLVGDG